MIYYNLVYYKYMLNYVLIVLNMIIVYTHNEVLRGYIVLTLSVSIKACIYKVPI